MEKYKHYKGGIYEYMFTATHSETEEELVIYRNSENRIFARPYKMFFEKVNIDGVEIPRFKKMEE
ncbi:DUF1653 domain-containing protein [Gracilibacillus marinus]|jgi:hypothetical protein|uniref:DUF1653 domain-containing protein n=1 Tax=Gracilibacillus marinus TaxID=630535 RepID=A0ABV8VVU8_9BACI